MKINIYGREAIEELLQKNFPDNVAVISFYDPPTKGNNFFIPPVDYSDKTKRVFQIAINDIDLECLGEYGFDFETYFTEAEELAEFIYAAKADGLDIICQCEYGQSRSAACAAAILEHFNKNGISIFADYRYYPNQLVYNKIFGALEAYKAGGASLKGYNWSEMTPGERQQFHENFTLSDKQVKEFAWAIYHSDKFRKYIEENKGNKETTGE